MLFLWNLFLLTKSDSQNLLFSCIFLFSSVPRLQLRLIDLTIPSKDTDFLLFFFYLYETLFISSVCLNNPFLFFFFKQVSLKICRMSIKKLYEDIWKSEKLEKRFPVQWCRKSWRLWKNYPFLKMTFGHKKKHFFANLRPLILLYC